MTPPADGLATRRYSDSPDSRCETESPAGARSDSVSESALVAPPASQGTADRGAITVIVVIVRPGPVGAAPAGQARAGPASAGTSTLSPSRSASSTGRPSRRGKG